MYCIVVNVLSVQPLRFPCCVLAIELCPCCNICCKCKCEPKEKKAENDASDGPLQWSQSQLEEDNAGLENPAAMVRVCEVCVASGVHSLRANV